MVALKRTEFDYVDYGSQGNDWQGNSSQRIKLIKSPFLVTYYLLIILGACLRT